MDSHISVIKTAYYCPYVYFIFSRDVIYIGETQIAPIRRWSSHLNSSGSFTKKLKLHVGNENCQEYLEALEFYCVNCLAILKNIESSYCGYRIPTQALEHKLHEIVVAQSFFGSGKKVISETIKTAPRNFFHWDLVNSAALSSLNSIKILMK